MSEKKTMKVIIKEPGFPPHLEEIENTLEELQRIVDGYIETVTIIRNQIIVICNEEGRLNGLEPNCAVCGMDFVGPVIICSADGDEFTDLKTPHKVMPLIRNLGGALQSLLI